MHSFLNRASRAVAYSWLAAGASFACVAAPIAFAQTSQQTDRLEEMLVVASRLPTQTYKIGRSISVLDKVQIDDLGHEYAADLFRFVPGVAVNRSGGYGGQAQLRIRGAEANHAVVLIDGVDVSAAGTGEFDMSALLSADIERIEVLRGPQSGLYGSNALGGVVNVITRRPESGFDLAAEFETGDHNTRHGALSLAGGTETVRGRLTYVQRRSEVDLSETGSEEDEDDNRTLSGRLLVDPSDNLAIEVFGRYTKKDTETDAFDFSGGPQQGTLVDDTSFSNTEDWHVGAAATLRLFDGQSVSKLSVAHTETDQDSGIFGSAAQRHDIRFDSSWQWKPSGGLEQRTTLFLQREDESFRNTVPFDVSQAASQERDLFGYGVEHQLAVRDALFVNASVRRDDNDDFDNSTSYGVDVSYRMFDSGTRLHASYGKGVTNPTFIEQFGFVPGSFAGNSGLSPEESEGWDVGVEQALFGGSLRVDLVYFNAELTGEIQPTVDLQSLLPSVINANGESDRKGVELSVSWVPSSGTSITAGYTYTDAQEPGGEEVRRPEHTASLSLAQALLDGRLRVAGGFVYNGEMFDSDFRNFFTNGFVTQRTELDSYTLVNLNVVYDLTNELEVFARVENLFDEDYQEIIGYATPGRAAFAGVRYRLKN